MTTFKIAICSIFVGFAVLGVVFAIRDFDKVDIDPIGGALLPGSAFGSDGDPVGILIIEISM